MNYIFHLYSRHLALIHHPTESLPTPKPDPGRRKGEKKRFCRREKVLTRRNGQVVWLLPPLPSLLPPAEQNKSAFTKKLTQSSENKALPSSPRLSYHRHFRALTHASPTKNKQRQKTPHPTMHFDERHLHSSGLTLDLFLCNHNNA